MTPSKQRPGTATLIDKWEDIIKQREAIVKQEEKIEQVMALLEDEETRELVKKWIVELAGVEPVNKQAMTELADQIVPDTSGEKNTVGLGRVEQYVESLPPGKTFTVDDIYGMSIAHRQHGDRKAQHPDFERQRKQSIVLSLSSLTRRGKIVQIKVQRANSEGVWKIPDK